MRVAGIHFVVTMLWASSLFASNYDLPTVREPLGISDTEAAALEKQGVKTTAALLERAGTPRAQAALAKASGIPKKKIAVWVAACDLMRIPGVGPEVVKLLTAVGVKDTRALAKQEAEKLSKKIEQTNEKQKLSEKTPSPEHLAAWIKAAAELPAPK